MPFKSSINAKDLIVLIITDIFYLGNKSNICKKPAVTTTQKSDKGKKTFQPNLIS